MESITNNPNKQGFFERRPGLTEIGSGTSERERKRATLRRWRKNHPGRSRELDAQWRKDHPERVRELSAHWRKDHPEQRRKLTARWRDNHPGAVQAFAARNVAQVKTCYVKSLIRQQTHGLLGRKDIPESLIKVKTRLIKLKRLCKTQRRPTPETNMTKSSG